MASRRVMGEGPGERAPSRRSARRLALFRSSRWSPMGGRSARGRPRTATVRFLGARGCLAGFAAAVAEYGEHPVAQGEVLPDARLSGQGCGGALGFENQAV
jgi:hypothetical protein